MDKKIRIVIVGLAVLLFVFFVIIIALNGAKSSIERERDELKKENSALSRKIEEAISENRRMREQMDIVAADMDKFAQERAELQNKLEIVSKEREQLIERLKKKASETEIDGGRAGMAQDAYWADILKSKADLELQMDRLKEQLKSISITNEQLQREKSALDLDLVNAKREREDLKRQLSYVSTTNQDSLDRIASDLVKERGDKIKIEESLKSIRGENSVLRRQLKSLSSRKVSLERKLMDAETELTQVKKSKAMLESKFNELDVFLKDNLSRLDRDSSSAEALRKLKEKDSGGDNEDVELPPIVVRPATSTSDLLVGRVAALNKENNFVIIDLGEEAGIKVGDTFRVYREGKTIGAIEVIQVRRSIAACDVKKETSPIRVGDLIK
jgi:chromosome segregation ATPase